MAEIPKYIKYDFLMTLLGLLCIGSAWYYTAVIKLPTESTSILWIIGGVFVLFGFIEMQNNYQDEQDLKQLNLILDKKEAFDKILNQGIISQKKEKNFINYLKKEFEDFFEKSKDRKISK